MATENPSSSPQAGPEAISSGDPGLLIEYSSFRDFVDLCSATLSELGMFVETDNPRPLGSTVRVELRIRDGFRLLQGQGEVVSIGGPTAGDGTAQGMSIRFTSIDEADRRLLAKVVEYYQRQGGKPFVPEAQERPGPQPEPEEATAAVGKEDSDRLAAEIPGLAEIEASVRAQPQPEEQPVVSEDRYETEEERPSTLVEPPADMEERPSTLVEPPPDMVAPAPPAADQSFADMESVGSTIIVPPAEAPPAGISTGSPSISPPIAQEPPMEVAVPPVEPSGSMPGVVSAQEPAPVSGLEVGEMGGEDVQWEEPVAISEPGAEGEETAPEPEKRFTDGLPDIPPPDELVVASGTLRWPEESGALTPGSGPIPPPLAAEVSPTAGVQRRQSNAFKTFLLFVLLALLAGAGFYRYRERLMPYVETYVEPYAGPTISRVRTFVEDQLDRLIGVDKPAGDWAAPGLEGPAAALDETAPSAEGQVLQPEPGPSEVPVRRPVVSEVSRIDRISWEELAGETLLILWTDGPVRRDQVVLARTETGGVRAVIKIIGVERQPDQSVIAVETSHIERLRTAVHQEPVGSVLHVVADLTDSGVYVRSVEPQESRLEIYFARR